MIPVSTTGDVDEFDVKRLMLVTGGLKKGQRMAIRGHGKNFLITHLGENLHIEAEGETSPASHSAQVTGVRTKIDPKVWGPKVWYILHTSALTLYTIEARQRCVRNLVVPCGTCRTHWKKVLEDFPPIYSGISSFFAWSVNAHNAVNWQLGSPILDIHDAYLLWHSIISSPLYPKS